MTFLGGTGERVTLQLTEGTYSVTRGGDNAGGTIAVQGDQIQFKRQACGNGTYRWSLDGSSLAFTQIDTDPCDGRVVVLAGQIYTKSG